MSRSARVAAVLITAFLLSTGYSLFNLKHLSRSLGYDEVYYLYWVDDWDDYQMYYPHHLLFVANSALFQRHFTRLTGITNTAFIQKLKNNLFVSLGLGLFFLLFYAHSRRFWLSLTIAVSIGLSASLWRDAHHHETAAIPGMTINLTMLLLLFYRKFRHPAVFSALFAVLNGFAILLHQVYVFSMAAVLLVLLFTKPEADVRFSTLRNLSRSLLYLSVVLVVAGGAYYYVGFVKLGLRLKDNPHGTQRLRYFEDIPINGNFVRYFYLIKAREKWGEIRPSSLQQAVSGYGSSFIITFQPDKVDLRDFLDSERLPSNMSAAAIGTFLAGFVLFFIPALRRYGMLYPALLLWMAAGSVFIYWWEPWYIEHWIYITILTWVLVFLVSTTVIEAIKPRLPRGAACLCFCLFLLTVAAVMYRQNFNHMILAKKEFSVPASVSRTVWKEEYRMLEIFREPSGQ